LFLPLKLGVFGAAFFLGVLIWLTLRMNKLPPPATRSCLERDVGLACGAMVLQIMGLAYIQPQFNAYSGVLTLALALAMSEQIRQGVVAGRVSLGSSTTRSYEPPHTTSGRFLGT
jgi:hypothetical protein